MGYFRVLTWNILHEFFAIKYETAPGIITTTVNGEKKITGNWKTRKILILNVLEKSKCDIICLQEVSLEARAFFEAELRKIHYIIAGCVIHSTLDHKNPYGNLIFYKPREEALTAFKLKTYRTLEKKLIFPQKLYITGRGELFVDFNVGDNTCIRVATTHLIGYSRFDQDPGSEQKKKEAALTGYNQLTEIIEYIEKDSDEIDCIMITGDFNEGFEAEKEDYSRLKLLERNGYIYDGNKDPSEPSTKTKIDHIYLKYLRQRELVTQITHETAPPGAEEASDHLPVLLKLLLRKNFVRDGQVST